MPLPFIIGAAALAGAAYGAKKGYDGYRKHSDAKDTIEASNWMCEQRGLDRDKQEEKTKQIVEKYGEIKIKIGSDFEKFEVLANKLLEKINQDRKEKLEIDIPKYQIQKVAEYTASAVGVMSTVAGAGMAGAAAGFAVYGGVMTLGAASTGTAISTLSGAAATKATLAAIGGGSVAAGGGGIALGTVILNASVAAPVLAIAGIAYDKYADKAKENAEKVFISSLEHIGKINKAIDHLVSVEEYINSLNNSVSSIYEVFVKYFNVLKRCDAFISADGNANELSYEVVKLVGNGYAVAAILTDIVRIPPFKLKEENGQIVMKENSEPEMLTDEDGFWILNEEILDKAQEKGLAEVNKYILD